MSDLVDLYFGWTQKNPGPLQVSFFTDPLQSDQPMHTSGMSQGNSNDVLDHVHLNGSRFDENRYFRSAMRCIVESSEGWNPYHLLIWGKNARGVFRVLCYEAGRTIHRMDSFSDGYKFPIRWINDCTDDPSIKIRRLLLICETAETCFESKRTSLQLSLQTKNQTIRHNLLVIEGSTRANKIHFSCTQLSEPLLPSRVEKVTLRIFKNNRWKPRRMYLFGLDTVSGRPNGISTLLACDHWSGGSVSKTETDIQGYWQPELQV